jgi:threonyl-tRNA synthetase
VLATAVRRLRPGAEIGFGPAIEEGFYYDFGVEEPFTPEDLERFEAEMLAVIEADHPFERKVVEKAEARELFHDDPLKLERLEELRRRRDHHGLPGWTLPRPVSGSPRSLHRPPEALPSPFGGRRLLAR